MDLSKPNILFIMTDQHRSDYLGCAGASFLRTPSLDRLAARGIRFRNCFTNSPVCAPARISLAAGLDPKRTGALDNSAFLASDATTYYTRLRDHGYRVGCVGKLDLAKPDQYNGRHGDRPRVFCWGFTHPEEVEGKEHSLMSPTPLGPYGFWLREQDLYERYYQERKSRKGMERWHMPSELPKETFLDWYQGQRAVEWLRHVPTDFPWHYFVSFSGPHLPHDPPREYAERYANARMPAPIPIPSAGAPECMQKRKAPEGLEPKLNQSIRRAYCAYIELIDEWIGRILAVLEERRLSENTFIFFSSDHGEMLGDLGHFGKSVPYEAALHVPLIVAGPDIRGGQLCDAIVELSDINPTICQLAGLAPQAGIDARSFRPCLANPGHAHRTEAASSITGFDLIRTEAHKLVGHANGEKELYDLRDDPAEERNVFDKTKNEKPELVNELRDRLHSRLRIGAAP